MKKYRFFIIGMGIVFLIIFFLIIAFYYSIPVKDTPSIDPQSKKKSTDLPISTFPDFVKTVNQEQDKVLTENDDYEIYYTSANKTFFIFFKNNPNQSRIKAEKNFLNSLNITEDQACQINVILTIDMNYNEDLAGVDYNLSFCPDGKPFPEK